MHAKGWSEEQAVKYFLDNSATTEAQARSEIRRYLVMPGQATSYKIWIRSADADDYRGGLSLRVTKESLIGMNPAHIIYQALTDWQRGRGLNAAQRLDLDTFEACADTFHAEGMGLCFSWNKPAPMCC